MHRARSNARVGHLHLWGLDENPQGSQIQRAALAAAWQFRIRPPKKGGHYLVGSWVRIRYVITDH